MEEYVAMMKNLEKKMISTGKDLEEKEIVSYILFFLKRGAKALPHSN
jgi:hypothetical protein